MTIFDLLVENKGDATALFSVLEETVVDSESGSVYQRNCQLVARYLSDNFKKVAYVLQLTSEQRYGIYAQAPTNAAICRNNYLENGNVEILYISNT